MGPAVRGRGARGASGETERDMYWLGMVLAVIVCGVVFYVVYRLVHKAD